MYDYQKGMRFFAQTAEEIKDLAAGELSGLGASGIKTAHRGVYFKADNEALYKDNGSAHQVLSVSRHINKEKYKCH
jgi:23S rRNA G2445 N2-methylase RlmL